MPVREQPKRSIKFKSHLIPVLVLILLGIQLFFPFKGWVILLSGFGGIWLLSYTWARALKNGLRLEREMRFGWMQVGDQLQERIALENDSRIPALWVQVSDHSNLPGYSISSVTTVRSQWYHHWFRHGVCARRGIYTLGPTSLETGDPFGVYKVRVDYGETVTMMVVPPVIPLPEIEIAPGGRTGEGHSTGRGLEQTVNAGGVREYVPGDSLRWIHWGTTARKGKPYVRVFDHTPSSNWWIMLDMDPEVQVGEGQHSTEEHGVILAASLVHRGLQMGKLVGLIAHGDELIWQPPSQGDTHLWRILRSLAKVHPSGPPLTELLEHTRISLEQHTSLIVITPRLNPEWLGSLGLLQRGGVVPTILLLNPVSFGGVGNPRPIQNKLLALGIKHYNINADLQDRSENVSAPQDPSTSNRLTSYWRRLS
ncbi:MAG: DUF58 domain-containing protein [Chloroflexota bacterium]|nr:DUF58 domain-containing protein [Chloroflexota bacterium]